jgi:Tfp pilus assembly protein PilN
MRSEINLATRPLVNTTPIILLLSALGAGAFGLTAWNLTLYLETRAEARAVESQLRAIRAEETALSERRIELTRRLQGTNLEELERRVDSANQVLSEKAVSWSLLLERLQEVLPWQVRLDSIRTSVGQRAIRLSLDLRTREPDYYWELIERLEGHPCFANVYPASQASEEGEELEVTLQLDHDPWCGRERPAELEDTGRSRRAGRRRG